MLSEVPFTLPALRSVYAAGVTSEAVVAEAFARLDRIGDPGIFLNLDREGALAAARALGKPDGRPLWGMPFAVKDNIDVGGMPTTGACPDAAYVPEVDAVAVSNLKASGAICLGKTNLDQFATGLVGVRTPYPAPKNALDPKIVPGGSSSGSAVAVAHGLVPFSLGTDTAGSGRVPAALNGIVGLKPTLGAVSATGMMPACRTLDTISVFARSAADAWSVFGVIAGYDETDAYSRRFDYPGHPEAFRPGTQIGAPDRASLRTFGDAEQVTAFERDLGRLESAGAEVLRIDFTPFYDVAELLYSGAWLAERAAALGDRLTLRPDTLHPVTRSIIEPALKMSAIEAFEGQYRLAELRRLCEHAMSGVELLCVPTIPSFVTVDSVKADPVTPNSQLGTYTNFVNLLDLCGVAVTTGTRTDGRPSSVTLLARSGEDAKAVSVGYMVEAGRSDADGAKVTEGVYSK